MPALNPNTGGGEGSSHATCRITCTEKVVANTGSSFDTTASSGTIRAGSHTANSTCLGNESSFCDGGLAKKTVRKTPNNFTKRGTGTGGCADSFAKKEAEKNEKARTDENKYNSKAKMQKATSIRANPPNTDLRTFYERGDLPVQLDHRGVKNALMWKVDIDQLDYHHYLPIFMTGLREIEGPYNFIAEQGCHDLIMQGKEAKVLPVIPQLIIPIKEALNTRRTSVMLKVMRVIRKLCQCETDMEGGAERMIGQALVPYYRQLLPVLNIFLTKTVNVGDRICYDQQNDEDMKSVIMETLEIMEAAGGDDAFINIKYLIPTYESVNA